LHTGPIAELRWVVAETEALRRFRDDTPASIRTQMIDVTRRWVMRDLRNGAAQTTNNGRAKEHAKRIFEQFDKSRVEDWDESRWEAFCLHLLWLICRDGIEQTPATQRPPTPFVRHRDWLLEVTGQDCDALVHDVLIRFCAAFLDQGFSDWVLPRRDSFFQSFASLYGRPLGPPDAWIRDLAGELTRIEAASLGPIESIAESLELLGVGEDEREAFLSQTLLALRGYAGMLWQVELRGDRVAHPAPPNSLIEFLAVRLVLDRIAAAYVARTAMSYRGNLANLRAAAARK
jgi:hypothetical protein